MGDMSLHYNIFMVRWHGQDVYIYFVALSICIHKY